VLHQLDTNYVNKITNINQRNKYHADIEKRMSLPLVTTALERAQKFQTAGPMVDGWLQATILERSKAITCDTQDKAKTEVTTILQSEAPTPNKVPGLTDGNHEPSIGKRDNISVFDTSITMNNESIRSATVRTVNFETGTVKSEFHFKKGDLEKFAGRKNTDAEMMKLVATNVLNQFIPMKAANNPIQLNIGDPPMPKSMIEAYIIYCDFKEINLEPPVGYRQFQEDLKKPGLFGRDSISDAFAKAWKISHSTDVGIVERMRHEATIPTKEESQSQSQSQSPRPR
jgi:hypothetical protein